MLLGALVHHGLLEDISLRIALRFVAEALAQPPGNKLLRFAQLAVGELRSDLGAWPDFCAQLLKVRTPGCLEAGAASRGLQCCA